MFGDVITEEIYFSVYNEVIKNKREDLNMSAININKNNFHNDMGDVNVNNIGGIADYYGKVE